MKAIIKSSKGSAPKTFETWEELQTFLEKKPGAIPLVIHIDLHLAQSRWSYDLELTSESIIKMIPVFRDIEERVNKIWHTYLDALPGDGGW